VGLDGGVADGTVPQPEDGGAEPDAIAPADGSATDGSVPDGAVQLDGQVGVDAAPTGDGGVCNPGLIGEVEPNNGYLDVIGHELGEVNCVWTLVGSATYPTDTADGFRMYVSAPRSVTFFLDHAATGADLDLGLYRVTAGPDGVLGTQDDDVTQAAYAGNPPPQTTEEFTVTLQPGAPYDLVVHALFGFASYTIDVTPQ
jgi:hypothetical protein